MIQTIEVIVSPSGETQIQTKGFAGSSCRQASAALEQSLGIKAIEQLTPEFYQPQNQTSSAREGQS